jgi:hypothetical protein
MADPDPLMEQAACKAAMDHVMTPGVPIRVWPLAHSAFLAGIRWERARVQRAIVAGTMDEDPDTGQWVLGLVKP